MGGAQPHVSQQTRGNKHRRTPPDVSRLHASPCTLIARLLLLRTSPRLLSRPQPRPDLVVNAALATGAAAAAVVTRRLVPRPARARALARLARLAARGPKTGAAVCV